MVVYLISSVFLFILQIVNAYTSDALKDQVTSLPRSTPLLSNQFSGFLEISSTKNIHYMYYESENDPENDPVVFWTNGGPGCSGLLGLFTEFGPWRPMKDGTLVSNPWSWTKLANLVFLEQPVGVGFSYGTNADELSAYNDYRASIDNLQIIKSFFEKFPERSNSPFYVASESYGGHYIPQWTLQLFGDADLRQRFKGMLVGNPFTSYASGSIAMANVMWGLQMVSKPVWDEFIADGCDSLDSSALDMLLTSPQCFEMADAMFNSTGPINPYALDFPVCTADYSYSYYYYEDFSRDDDSSGSSEKFKLGFSKQAKTLLKFHDRIRNSDVFKRSIAAHRAAYPERYERHSQWLTMLNDGSSISSNSGRVSPRKPKRKLSSSIDNISNPYNVTYDPCTADYTTAYLNDPEVQAALHVLRPDPTNANELITTNWAECDDYVNGLWSFSDYLSDTTDLYNTTFTHIDKPDGFKMLVFSGDSDGVCATVGTQNWVYEIGGSEVLSLYKPWYYNDSVYGTQQAGYLTQFNGNLSFATVHHAGHEVPAYQPEVALELFKQYLSGSFFNVTANSDSTTSTNIDATEGSSSVSNSSATVAVLAITLVLICAVGIFFGCVACYRSQRSARSLGDFIDEDIET